MNLLEPWNLTFALLFGAFVVIRLLFVRASRGVRRVEDRFGLLEKALLALLALGQIVLPGLYLLTPWLGFADFRPLPWMPWIGAALVASGAWLFWRSHVDLGLNWSVSLQIRQEHTLITRGVYSRIRHPMYTSVWMLGIGQVLLLHNGLAGLGTLVPFGLLYVLRIGKEERMMCDTFGEQYRDYMRTTGRLLPCWNAASSS